MQPTFYAQMKGFAANYGGLYTIEPLKDHAEARRLDCIGRNPDCYYIPLSAVLGLGARSFPATLFSNGTYGAGGVPNEASISSFFGAQLQPDGSYTSVPERFPDNWYRRGAQYGLVHVLADILEFQTTRDFTFGANAGKVNSFVPLNIAAATDVAGLGCIVRNAIQATLPTFTVPLVSGLLQAVNGLLTPLLGLFDQFNCPAYDPSNAAAYAAASTYLVSGERK
ncbi:hypothetical protein FRB95_006642 [Tulasnella sp. JGI-2019a]|nr:hypothetical protein FRB95_006642 [Tulasnella sp. JGI-2019a]